MGIRCLPLTLITRQRMDTMSPTSIIGPTSPRPGSTHTTDLISPRPGFRAPAEPTYADWTAFSF